MFQIRCELCENKQRFFNNELDKQLEDCFVCIFDGSLVTFGNNIIKCEHDPWHELYDRTNRSFFFRSIQKKKFKTAPSRTSTNYARTYAKYSKNMIVKPIKIIIIILKNCDLKWRPRRVNRSILNRMSVIFILTLNYVCYIMNNIMCAWTSRHESVNILDIVAMQSCQSNIFYQSEFIDMATAESLVEMIRNNLLLLKARIDFET